MRPVAAAAAFTLWARPGRPERSRNPCGPEIARRGRDHRGAVGNRAAVAGAGAAGRGQQLRARLQQRLQHALALGIVLVAQAGGRHHQLDARRHAAAQHGGCGAQVVQQRRCRRRYRPPAPPRQHGRSHPPHWRGCAGRPPAAPARRRRNRATRRRRRGRSASARYRAVPARRPRAARPRWWRRAPPGRPEPSSALMLDSVMRSCMDSARTASPQNSTA